MKDIKTKIKNFFFEFKLLFQHRKEDDIYKIPTQFEKGTSEVESVQRAFFQFYNPWNLISQPLEHPEDVISGTKERVIDELDGATTENVLNQKMAYKLQKILLMAPEVYNELLDSEIRRRGLRMPTSWASRDRKQLESEIAQYLFTYRIEEGEIYMTLLNRLQERIEAVGIIGNPMAPYLDINGRQIDLANPPAENIFNVTAGLPGEKVVIRWHLDDFATIRNKLERAGIIAQFSNLPGAREYLDLKFCISEAQRVLFEEKAKLRPKDRYDPQRLKTWLDNDLTAQALLTDRAYIDWYNGEFTTVCTARGLNMTPPPGTLSVFEQLQLPANADLLRMFNEQQKLARERTEEESLEGHLKKILKPGNLENLHDSKETQTMLAYLFHKLYDREDAVNTRNFIRELAGIGYEKLLESLEELKGGLDPFLNNFYVSFKEIEDKGNKIIQNNAKIGVRAPGWLMHPGAKPTPTPAKTLQYDLYEIDYDIARIGVTPSKPQESLLRTLNTKKKEIEDKIDAIKKENESIEEDVKKARRNVVLETSKLGKLLKAFRNNTKIWGKELNEILTNPVELAFIDGLPSNPASVAALSETEITTQSNALKASFDTNRNAITTLISTLELQKKTFEHKKKRQETEKPEKMDSRGLLDRLTERDLKNKGVTEATGIERKSVLTTNLLIADCRTVDIAKSTNEHTKAALEKSGVHTWMEQRWANASYFTSIYTGQDAIEHVIDTDKELAIFRDVNLFWTRNDMNNLLDKAKNISPQKIREFCLKIGEFIRGIEVERKPGLYSRFKDNVLGRVKKPLIQKIRVVDKDVPHLENFVHLLTLLEAQLTTENFMNEVEEREMAEPETNRAKLVLEMLETQSRESRELDDALVNSLQPYDARFKRLLNKAELKKELNEAFDELEALPREERMAELERRGLSGRLATRGIISIRAERAMKKAAIAGFKYGPTSWPFWILYGAGLGVGKGAKWFYNYAKPIVYTPASAAEVAEMPKRVVRGLVQTPFTVLGAVGSLVTRIAELPQKIVQGTINFIAPKKGPGGGGGHH